MDRIPIKLIATLVVLALVWVFFVSGLFDSEDIRISVQMRPNRVSKSNPGVYPVIFGLDRQYKFTSIKVVPAEGDDSEPLWHLVSDEGSQERKAFFYGEKLRNMKPAVEGAEPKPIEAGVKYRLIVEADGREGQIDFTSRAVEVAAHR
jgi:hypothetical protein